MRKLLIITFLITFTTNNMLSQKMFHKGNDFDIFHQYTQWGLQLDGLVYFPAIYDNPNAYSFQSQLATGYKLGLIYNLNINNHFGFKIGALTGLTPAINNFFILEKNQINTTEDYYHKKGAKYNQFFTNFSFPFLFEYRNFLIDSYIINLNAGIHVERTETANITENYQNFYNTTVANNGSWDIDLVLKLGWYYQFKPLMMQTNLVYKHRFNNQYEGNYSFTNINGETDINGNYVQKGDYIGISFDFYFRKPSREVEMGCRKNTHSKEVKKRQKQLQKRKEKAKKIQEKKKKKKAKKMREKAKKKWIFW